MIDANVARRYANALFMVAVSKDAVDITASELFQLKSFIDKDRVFLDFLLAPQILTEHKKALINTLFRTRLSPPLLSFLQLLIEKSRIEHLGDIAREFEKLLEVHKGIIKARVTTAIAVDEEFKKRLRARLEALSGKKIEIIHRIDKAIIGGIIVQLNYKVIDRSIRYQLTSLKHGLLALRVY
jgi:F-type H+-transporting ATPase subunit delta